MNVICSSPLLTHVHYNRLGSCYPVRGKQSMSQNQNLCWLSVCVLAAFMHMVSHG